MRRALLLLTLVLLACAKEPPAPTPVVQHVPTPTKADIPLTDVVLEARYYGGLTPPDRAQRWYVVYENGTLLRADMRRDGTITQRGQVQLHEPDMVYLQDLLSRVGPLQEEYVAGIGNPSDAQTLNLTIVGEQNVTTTIHPGAVVPEKLRTAISWILEIGTAAS